MTSSITYTGPPTATADRQKSPLIGFWACNNVPWCCYNNGQGTTPEDSNIAIQFSGTAGLNTFNVNEGTPCEGMDECWVNFGGGGTPVEVSKYIQTGSAGSTPAPTDLLKKTLKNLVDNKYTGVTFDYENDEPGVTIDDWKELNQQFQQAGLKTALTMAQAGLGTNVDLGYGSKKGFLAAQVPFDYNIPQLYGGNPLFYTGEYNDQWGTASIPFKGYGLSGGGDCTSLDPSNPNCTPLKVLCENLHSNTALLPSFGGQPPEGGMVGLRNLIGDNCGAGWDGKSFISWNITDPNKSDSGAGNACKAQ